MLKRNIYRLVAIAAVFVMVAAACGDSDEGGGDGTGPAQLTPVKVQLQWFAQSQFAGYYAAKDRGFYADEGLDVTILEGGVDIVPQQVLATGGAEFGIAWVPKALVSREAGADIVNIAQVFQRSGTLEVSWADSGINGPEDWAGKTVGNWGFGNEYELTAAIEKFNVPNVTLVQQDFSMTALLNREIDAAEAMIYNEYAQVLEATNPETGQLYQPSDLVVIDFNELGTAMLQDAIWVNRDWIEQDGNEEIAEKFLRATFRGWIWCRDNFQNCVDIVLANGSTLGSSHQAWQLNEINALIWPSSNGLGVMDEELWAQTVEVATTQIPELEGVDIGDDAYRTDLAEAALEALEDEGLDINGNGFTRRVVQLTPGGE